MSWFDILKADSIGKLQRMFKKLLKKVYHKRLGVIHTEPGGKTQHIHVQSDITGNIVILHASKTPRRGGQSWVKTQNKDMKNMFMDKFEEDITPYMDKNWEPEE